MIKCPVCGAITDSENPDDLEFKVCEKCKRDDEIHLVEYKNPDLEKMTFEFTGRIITLRCKEFDAMFHYLNREIREKIKDEHALLVSNDLFQKMLKEFGWEGRLN